MINFIDINTGKIFEGSKPYVFYFDDKQSIGINYVKKILFISDTQYIKCIINHDSIFKLVDIGKSDNEYTINDFVYKDLTKMISNNVLSQGYLYNGYYIHAIYVLCQSNEEGTFIDDIKLQKQSGNELLTISVGAIFHGENESLKINLSNFGFEIPDQFQKAIYETNIREDVSDNVLINRKYKELLNENINILANKGSYRSLFNALNWFEYGDLIRIQEYWKHDELGKTVLSGTELNQYLSESLKNLLSWSAKTTYIGIYYALNNVRYVDDRLVYNNDYNKLISAENVNDIILLPAEVNTLIEKSYDRILQIGSDGITINDYETPGIAPYLGANYTQAKGSNFKLIDVEEKMYLLDEPIPMLFDVVDKWTKEDMMLKLALLGNFYATYFMPIHLDLIHSTVENIIFTNTIKVINFNKLDRNDYIDILDSVICTNVSDGDIFYIKETGQLEVYSITPGNTFNLIDLDNSWEDASAMILGVDTGSREYKFDDVTLRKYLSQYYNGLGSVVDFNFLIENIEKNTFIKQIQICIGESIYNTFTNIPANNNLNFNLKLLFKAAGDYHIGFNFICSNSKNYIITKNITVCDDTNQYIRVKKVIKRNLNSLREQKSIAKYDILKDLLSFSPAFSVLNNTVANKDEGKNRLYTDYFYLGNDIGKNHFVLLNKNEFNGDVKIYYKNNNLTLDKDITIEKLSARFPHYYWDEIDNSYNESKKYIIGINKYFYIDNDKINYYHKEGEVYIKGNKYPYQFEYSVNSKNEIILDFQCNYNNYTATIAVDYEDYNEDIQSVIKNLNIKEYEYLIKYQVKFDNNIVLDFNFNTELYDEKLFYGTENCNIKFKSDVAFNTDNYHSDYRFFRFFHDVMDIDDNYIFDKHDTLYVEIEIPYSKDFKEIGWEFVNVTTGKSFQPKSKTNKLIHPKSARINNELTRGYYNIIFNYKLGAQELKKELNSAFLIK